MYSLQQSLVDYDIAMLRVLARTRGVALESNRQTEAVDQLAAALIDPLSIRVALAQLSPQGRDALGALTMVGGRMRAPQFSRRFGQVRPTGPGRLAREEPWNEPSNPAEELYYLGLVYRAFHQDPGGAGEFFFIPSDLQSLLPPPQTEPPVFSVKQIPAPESWADGGPAVVEDLFRYLAYIHAHDVQPYADGRLGRRDLAALGQSLTQPDRDRLAFLHHLAGQLRLVALYERVLRLEPAAAKKWLDQHFEDQLAALQRAWLEDSDWDDLSHVSGIVCERQGSWLPKNDPVATRRSLLGQLARCPLDTWWSASSFVAAVKEFHPDFQRPDGDYRSWYVREAASGAYLSGFDSWDRVEGALIAHVLARPLAWLGVVSAAEGPAGPAYKLTPAGARLLGLERCPEERTESPPIVVSPDFLVEAPAPVSLYVRFQLDRFADQVSQNPCRYRLTAPSLARSLSRGVEVEPIVAFLKQASGRPVPTNVVAQLRLWAGRFDQVRLQDAALLTVRSERVLKELSVLPETRSLISTLVSPTSALVRGEDLSRLRRELSRLGYLLPAGSRDDVQETD